jgi:hypothetical protein
MVAKGNKVANEPKEELTPEEPEAKVEEPEVGTPQQEADPSKEAEQPSAELSVEEKLADAVEKLRVSEANRKSLQRNLEAARTKGTNEEALLKKIYDLEEGQAILIDMIESAPLPAQAEGTYPSLVQQPHAPQQPQGVQQPGQRYRELMEKRKQEEGLQSEKLRTSQFIQQMIVDAGIDPTAPELEPARTAFMSGNFQEAKDLATTVVTRLSVAKTRDAGVSDDEKVQAGVEKILKEKGLLDTDVSGSSAPPTGAAKVREDYGEGRISTEEYNRRCSELGITP